jgi:site-specific recombinase XerD
MRVRRVLMPNTGTESWTLLGDDHGPVEPVERWLAHLTAIGRSPNTVKGYAHDLKDWFVYLRLRHLDWRGIELDEVGRFLEWLLLAPEARDGRVLVLPSVNSHCTESSMVRKLAALRSFYLFHVRHGVDLGELLVILEPGGRRRGSWKPFLDHVSKDQPQRRSTIKLRPPNRRPRVLAARQVQAILDACAHLRDRLLFAVLFDTGVRIGEALGLRHEDLAVAERELTVTPRRNDNRARAKSPEQRTVPVSPELVRLYADYLHGEYGELDSDYVFVNLWGQPRGHPMTYRAVYDLVERLRQRTGVDFQPHQFRHTYATWLLRNGAGKEAVKELLGHAHISTTIDIYGHLTVEDTRRALEQAGWFADRKVRL